MHLLEVPDSNMEGAIPDVILKNRELTVYVYEQSPSTWLGIGGGDL